MTGIGIGISDFKMLRNRDNYYIDKTIFIKEDKEKTIEETIENAKKQIEDRQYEQNLQERGFKNITKMVYAFKGKELKMEIY